jgi:hypothetical protein
MITNPSVGIIQPFAVTSYAFNYQVFGYTGVAWSGSPAGQMIGGTGGYSDGYAGNARIPATFTDGTTNTILFAEKYAKCLTSNRPPINGPGTERGALWAWWDTGWVYYPRFGWQTVEHRAARRRSSRCDRLLHGIDQPVRRGSRLDQPLRHERRPGRRQRPRPSSINPQTWWDLCTPTDGRSQPRRRGRTLMKRTPPA